VGRILVGLIATVLIAQEHGSIVSGAVVDEITGLPIAGAHVGIGLVTELNSSALIKTDIEGKFQLADVRPGRYWIDCSAAGYVKIAGYRLEGPQVDVPASGNARPVTVRLTPAAAIEGLLGHFSRCPLGRNSRGAALAGVPRHGSGNHADNTKTSD